MSKEAKKSLDKVAGKAKDQGRLVRVRGSSGRTDLIDKTTISEHRADAVRNYLAEVGLDPGLVMSTPLDPSSVATDPAESVEVVTCAQSLAQQLVPPAAILAAPAMPTAPSPQASLKRARIVIPAPPQPSEAPPAAVATGEPEPGWEKESAAWPAGPTSVTEPTARAPMTLAPWETAFAKEPRTEQGSMRTQIGVEVMLGGGVTGFVDKQARNFTDPGGSWEARVAIGTRLPVSFEAAYVGSVQNIQALGLSDDAVLLGSAAEATARVNLTRLRVQPYVFGGVGWQHYDMTNAAANASAIRDSDDLVTIPAGLGVSFRLMDGLVLDVRGTFRAAFDEDLMNAPYAATGQDANLHSWDAGARIGWEF